MEIVNVQAPSLAELACEDKPKQVETKPIGGGEESPKEDKNAPGAKLPAIKRNFVTSKNLI